jgi:hypothetical protein
MSRSSSMFMVAFERFPNISKGVVMYQCSTDGDKDHCTKQVRLSETHAGQRIYPFDERDFTRAYFKHKNTCCAMSHAERG